MTTMPLLERVAKRRALHAVQTVARQAPRSIAIKPLIACDTDPAMQQGHAEALLAWLDRDPNLVAPKPVTAIDATTGAKEWPPQRVRAIRARLGWEREELARAVGVTVQSVAKWERGESSPQRQFWDALTEIERRSLGGD